MEVEVRRGPNDGAVYTIQDGAATLRIPLMPPNPTQLGDGTYDLALPAARTLELPIRHDTTGRHYVLWPQGAS